MWLYVIYRNPRDYPGMYVVRRHWVDSAGSSPELAPLTVTPSLAVAREQVVGLENIGREPGDDPAILEVWI